MPSPPPSAPPAAPAPPTHPSSSPPGGAPRLTTDDRGRAVLVRRASDPADRQALRAEAAAGRRARHPGVVEVRSFEDGPDESVLVVAHAGNRTLRSAAPLPVAEAAGVVAALAETLADLHALGIVHGRLDADQVALGRAGRPVLGGLGRAGEPPPPPHADVAALGALLHELLPPDPAGGPDGPPIELFPHRRPWWPRRDRDGERRAVLNLADQALADDPAARPSARRLAHALVTTVPDARLPLDSSAPVTAGPPAEDAEEAEEAEDLPADTGRPGPGDRRGRRGGLGAVALVGAVLLTLGLAGLRPGPRPSPAPAASPAALPHAAAPGSTTARAAATPGSSPATGVTAPVAPAGDASTATAGSPPATGAPAAEACAGGPCTEVTTDGVVRHAGRRFAVGEAGDEATVGDWDCDGEATVVLLRPATGEVFTFAAWAGPGHAVPAAGTGTVPAGSHLVPAPLDADGCALPLVRAPDGRTFVPAVPGALP